MTREERISDIKIILNHIDGVKNDLFRCCGELEELRCKREANGLDVIVGRLEEWQHRVIRNRLS